MMQAGWLSKYSMRWPWPLLTPQRVPHHGAALFLLQIKNLKTHLALGRGKRQMATSWHLPLPPSNQQQASYGSNKHNLITIDISNDRW